MSITAREVLGTLATLLSTELNALANNASVLSSVIAGTGVYNNTAGSGASTTTGDGYERALVQFLPGGAFAGTPAAASSIDIYFLKQFDGTNYEMGGTNLVPPRSPDVSIPLNSASATAVANTISRLVFALPACNFMILAKNNGSGQALPASGNTITLKPATDQGS